MSEKIRSFESIKFYRIEQDYVEITTTRWLQGVAEAQSY